MLRDYASTGGQEVWNTSRTKAYLTNVGSPFATGPDICTCDALTPAVLGETFLAYRTPVLDPAPWYDAGFPVSGEFLGFVPLSVTGADGNPRARTVTNAVGGGGVFGPSRALPRTVTVQGILIGASCCGADYGLQYLSEVLSGCTGDQCDGDCFEMYDCCPEPGMTPQQFNAAHRRTFRRTALVSGPTVVRRDGSPTCAAGACAGGGEIITVEFVLVAASPWAWSDPTPLLDVKLPQPGTSECVEWCLRAPTDGVGEGGCDPSECLFGDCSASTTGCTDPRNPVPAPPQPVVPPTSFCIPLGNERACYEIDLSTRSQWSSDVPQITLTAGSGELRNVRVVIYEKPAGTILSCDGIADANRCEPHSQYFLTFLQAGGTMVVDGQTGRSVTECNGVCQTSTNVYGDQDGGPVRVRELTCANYCLCIETDPTFPPANDAMLSFAVSGRGM